MADRKQPTQPRMTPMSDLVAAALGANPSKVSDFVGYLGGLSDEQRVTVFQALSDFFCRYCGRQQPPGDCQCRNDE
jgi:hypothetical protein